MKPVCDICGRAAVGVQLFGCCASTVCEEHADEKLRELRPGERRAWGECCYFYRFEEDRSDAGEGPSPKKEPHQ